MSPIQPHQLKELRKACGLTVGKAALSVHVHERTWRTYETDVDNASHIRIPQGRLMAFCERHELPYPPVGPDGQIMATGCKVLSITTYKGGVGKSPITVAVAGVLASAGRRVAIVSNDRVFNLQGKEDSWISARLEGRARSVDFIGEDDVLMYPGEVEHIEQAIQEYEHALHDPDWITINPLPDRAHEKLLTKRVAPQTFEDLRTSYDYIFLDLNRDLEKVRLLSDLVVIVMDNSCIASVWSAGYFYDDLVKPQLNRSAPRMCGLVTNHAPSTAFSDFEEYIEDSEKLEEARSVVMSIHEQQADVLQAIRDLRLPLLRTFMTRAHLMEIQMHNRSRSFGESFCFFNSLVEIAPQSVASDEIRRLTEELCSMLSLTMKAQGQKAG
ncbi:MAG TPA: AAA family ATPase [Pseudomonas sp.]